MSFTPVTEDHAPDWVTSGSTGGKFCRLCGSAPHNHRMTSDALKGLYAGAAASPFFKA